ncbi:4-alpha-glucanotransferase, partial [Burkholderia thailandensis]|uniref:4-alpha-glucanotransferase n=1 Tax=Burkholderia thailandensis TaxID=57975 RepID=UPI002877444E
MRSARRARARGSATAGEPPGRSHAWTLSAPGGASRARVHRWGLAPWRVQRLADVDFAPFAAVLDAAVRGAGALRSDHAAGLMRQCWVPRGRGAHGRVEHRGE